MRFDQKKKKKYGPYLITSHQEYVSEDFPALVVHIATEDIPVVMVSCYLTTTLSSGAAEDEGPPTGEYDTELFAFRQHIT